MIIDAIKKYYVINVKGYDPNKMVVCTLLFVGDEARVHAEEKHIYSIAAKY